MFTLLGLALDTVVWVIIGFISLAILLVVIIGQIKLFTKCGQAGWKAIIPFYSSYVFTCKICKLHWAWFVAILLIDLAIVNFGSAAIFRMFVKAMSFYNLALMGHRDNVPALVFGALFPEIVTIVYGLGNYEYDDLVDVKQSGLF